MSEPTWAGDGLMLVRQALSRELLQELLDAVDALYTRFLAGSIRNWSLGTETATTLPGLWEKLLRLPRHEQSFRRWNVAADGAPFRKMIDYEPILAKVVGLISPDIQLFKSQLIVVPPAVREEPYLHTDSGTLGRVRNANASQPLMLSVQYFLTPLLDESMGNFTYVPGSHRLDFPIDPDNLAGRQSDGYVQGRHIEGRVQLRVDAGDTVIFPHSLWHGVSANTSHTARKTLIYSYSLSCLRPYDYESAAPELLAVCTPRQRRLLGDLGGWAWRPGCHHHPPPDQHEALGDVMSPAGSSCRVS